MTGAVLLAGLVFVLLVVLAVVVIYSVRLGRASRQAAGSADRFREFMRNQEQVTRSGAEGRPRFGSGALNQAPLLSSRPAPFPVHQGAGGDLVVSDARVGLASVADAPVYLACEKGGTVLVQLGAKPLAPLSYVLDPRAHQALRQVAIHATAKFGRSWSILAWDDPQGSLTLRRLS